jgi:hypothetical protein
MEPLPSVVASTTRKIPVGDFAEDGYPDTEEVNAGSDALQWILLHDRPSGRSAPQELTSHSRSGPVMVYFLANMPYLLAEMAISRRERAPAQ